MDGLVASLGLQVFPQETPRHFAPRRQQFATQQTRGVAMSGERDTSGEHGATGDKRLRISGETGLPVSGPLAHGAAPMNHQQNSGGLRTWQSGNATQEFDGNVWPRN